MGVLALGEHLGTDDAPVCERRRTDVRGSCTRRGLGDQHESVAVERHDRAGDRTARNKLGDSALHRPERNRRDGVPADEVGRQILVAESLEQSQRDHRLDKRNRREVAAGLFRNDSKIGERRPANRHLGHAERAGALPEVGVETQRLGRTDPRRCRFASEERAERRCERLLVRRALDRLPHAGPSSRHSTCARMVWAASSSQPLVRAYSSIASNCVPVRSDPTGSHAAHRVEGDPRVLPLEATGGCVHQRTEETSDVGPADDLDMEALGVVRLLERHDRRLRTEIDLHIHRGSTVRLRQTLESPPVG